MPSHETSVNGHQAVNSTSKDKLYVAKEPEGTAFYDDGREVELLHFIYNEPDIDDVRGSPERVLAKIDKYATTKKYLMNVGHEKGQIVCNLIAEKRPQTMVELGGYVGYSALLFGNAIRKAGGRRYHSLEKNPVFGAIVASLVELAGLSETVKVHVGPSDASLRRLHANGALQKINLLFLDHFKPAYVTDLKLCEELSLIVPGSALAADNVVSPGNPPYLEYVRSNVKEKKERLAKQDSSTTVQGNPGLVYQSALHESPEPTGDPVRALNLE
ncbi:MAG: hypothetical protein Q9227_004367 [Pyrenula ochraceoflavens]